MNKLTEKELKELIGGATITSAIINAFTNVIKVLLDAGRNIGSGVRRITSNNLCEIK